MVEAPALEIARIGEGVAVGACVAGGVQARTRVGEVCQVKTRLDQHVQAVLNEEILYASVLIHCYALAESAAMEALALTRASGGIEEWGCRLLSQAGADWASVKDGEAGV